MSKVDEISFPYGLTDTRGKDPAGALLYGYAGADLAARGSAPVGVGPGNPTLPSGGKRVEFVAAGRQG